MSGRRGWRRVALVLAASVLEGSAVALDTGGSHLHSALTAPSVPAVRSTCARVGNPDRGCGPGGPARPLPVASDVQGCWCMRLGGGGGAAVAANGKQDVVDDGAEAGMDMTETLDPSVEGKGPGKSPLEGVGSSYMGTPSSAGAGSGGSGGGMGSSSAVKIYRHPTNSKQRNLIRDRFAAALTPFQQENSDKYTPLTAAIAIEHSMFRYFGKDETNSNYLGKARSILWNIKDPENPELRRRLLDGSLQPERLTLMDTPEMASDNLKQQRKIYAALAMKAATLGNVDDIHAATDMFFCRKCKTRKCTYYQVSLP